LVRVYVPLTFLFLGWAFFEASGGVDFVPAERPVAVAQAPAPAPVAAPAVDPEPAAEPTQPATFAQTQPTPEPSVAVAEPAPPVPAPAFTSLSTPGNSDIGAAPPDEAPISLATPEAAPDDVRLVAGDRVNMRTGPGTVYPVVTTLDRDTEVAVVEISTNGWASIEVLATGEIGWMSLRLLTDPQ